MLIRIKLVRAINRLGRIQKLLINHYVYCTKLNSSHPRQGLEVVWHVSAGRMRGRVSRSLMLRNTFNNSKVHNTYYITNVHITFMWDMTLTSTRKKIIKKKMLQLPSILFYNAHKEILNTLQRRIFLCLRQGINYYMLWQYKIKCFILFNII